MEEDPKPPVARSTAILASPQPFPREASHVPIARNLAKDQVARNDDATRKALIPSPTRSGEGMGSCEVILLHSIFCLFWAGIK